MERQLQWLSDLVEAMEQKIEVIVSYVAPLGWDGDVRRIVACRGLQVDPEASGLDRRNTFEYPGFRAMKALAKHSHDESIIFYCHSKGIFQLSEGKMGLFLLHTHIGLTANLDALECESGPSKAGIFPSRYGWCWYNFFWVKAGYLAQKAVEESADRHHFEALIGERGAKEGYRSVLPLIDCLSFEDSGMPVKPWYRAEETTTPTLQATYRRYAQMASPPASVSPITPVPAGRGASCPG